MSKFQVRKIAPQCAKELIEAVGFDKDYSAVAVDKYRFQLIKVEDLTPPQANIVKQLALSIGADAAVHREVITCKVEKTDAILAGSVCQLRQLANKLKFQPFSLNVLAEEIFQQLDLELTPLKIRNTKFAWGKKTYVMGILNVTPDSFSDGGSYNTVQSALVQVEQMVLHGVDIIDIGGESTRPFAQEVSVEEELSRVIPVIQAIRKNGINTPVSIDTRNAQVANQAVLAGADIINDVSGFDHDNDMVKVAVEHQVPVVLMHSKGSPDEMQVNPEYQENVVDVISKKLFKKVQKAINAGVKKENIILDPGIGFGKTLEHNLEIINRICEFTSLGCPLLLGVSRKSLIGNILEVPTDQREEASIALNSYLASNGVDIVRVHDVDKTCKALKVLDKVVRR